MCVSLGRLPGRLCFLRRVFKLGFFFSEVHSNHPGDADALGSKTTGMRKSHLMEKGGHSERTLLAAGKTEQRSKVRSITESRVCEEGWVRLEWWVRLLLKKARDT